jgi:hypothetical protein
MIIKRDVIYDVTSRRTVHAGIQHNQQNGLKFKTVKIIKLIISLFERVILPVYYSLIYFYKPSKKTIQYTILHVLLLEYCASITSLCILFECRSFKYRFLFHAFPLLNTSYYIFTRGYASHENIASGVH